jgi:hypothetical protein
MQRVRLRRFVLVAALAVVAGIGLAGCQNQPGTAGYVGSTRFTDADIEATTSQVQADVAHTHPGNAFPTGDLRSYLVQRMVLNELLRQYAAEQKVKLPAPDYATAAQNIGLPEDDAVVRLNAEENAYVKALVAAAKPVTPTETDLKDIYNNANDSVSGGIGSFEQNKASIASFPMVGNALALKSGLTETAQRIGVGISPRYGPAELPILQTSGQPSVVLISVTVGGPNGSPAVTDSPSPPPAVAQPGD